MLGLSGSEASHLSLQKGASAVQSSLQRLFITSQIAVLTVLVGLSSTVQAIAPANAVLEVEVSVTIGGAVLEQESPSFSGVKVNLIPSEPTVTGTGAAAFEGDSATLAYTITTTANGFDTYTLTPALGTLDGVTGTPSLTF